MAKIRVKLRELKNADVRFISLVDRAATRIPFRVLKKDGETEMDLTKIFKGETPKPEVAAVVVFAHPEEMAEQVRQSIATAGFTTDRVQKSDDETVLYSQSENGDGAVIVRLSDQTVVAIKNLQTELVQKVIDAHGFLPDPQTMMNEYAEQIELAIKSEQPLAELREATEAMGNYLSVFGSLPSTVLKLDAAIREVVEKCNDGKKKVEKEMTEEEAGETENATEDEEMSVEEMRKKMKAKGHTDEEIDAMMAEKGKTKKEEASAEEKVETPAAETPSADAGQPVEQPAETPKVEEEAVPVVKTDLSEVLAALKGIGEQVATLTQKVDAVASTQEEQKKVLDETAKKADTLEGKLNGVVVAPPPAGDRPAKETVEKKEDTDPRRGCFDTAFLPGRRNRR